jgi:nucleoside-diphosphate-sugar epimerase
LLESVSLVTGAFGFLGRYLVEALVGSGSKIVALDLPGRGFVADIACDLRSSVPDFTNRRVTQVYHLAGLAHLVPRSPAVERRFYQVNLEGTRNLLKGLDELEALPEAVVFISTVAVYGLETGEMVDENASRMAEDPYGKSKRLAEDLVIQWCEANRVRCGIVRLPLVAGRGAPGNLGAMIRAVRGGWYLAIGNGEARRSMVLADDVAKGLMLVASRGGVFHLTDGEHPRMRDLEDGLCKALGRPWLPRIPLSAARAVSRVGDFAGIVSGLQMPFDTRRYSRLTTALTYSDDKARRQLGWSPRGVLGAISELV